MFRELEMQMKAEEVWNEIAEQMLSDISNGTMPWECPWDRSVGMPISGATGKPYRGVNVFILWAQMVKHGWTDHRFYTFKQAKAQATAVAEGETGGVRKGEKSVKAIFTAPRVVLPKPGINGKCWFAPNDPVLLSKYPTKKSLPEGSRKLWVENILSIFNAAQIDGLPPVDACQGESVTDAADRMVKAKAVADACAKSVLTAFGSGNCACYVPMLDQVHMPAREAFKSAEDLYATLFHEYSHASGHGLRLNRDQMNAFGEEKYAKEELVAESGAAFVMASLGLPYRSQHASYLANWAKTLPAEDEEDRKIVLKRAFSAGQKAADCVLSGLPSVGDEAEDEPVRKAA